MTASFHDRVRAELADIDSQGLTKPERIIASRQGPVIRVGGRDVVADGRHVDHEAIARRYGATVRRLLED